MQQFNLTEEQSKEYIDTLQDLIDLYEDYNNEASAIVIDWYNRYNAKNRHWFSANKSSINSFLNYISIGAPIYHIAKTNQVTDLGGCHYTLYRTRLSKLTDQSDDNGFLKICNECNIVEKCVRLPENIITDCKNKLKLLEKYSNIPFTLSEEWLKHKDSVEFYIKKYKATLHVYKFKKGS